MEPSSGIFQSAIQTPCYLTAQTSGWAKEGAIPLPSSAQAMGRCSVLSPTWVALAWEIWLLMVQTYGFAFTPTTPWPSCERATEPFWETSAPVASFPPASPLMGPTYGLAILPATP